MANQKKTWFLVPGWDIPPSAIKLGSIIADPTAPQKAIITPESLQSQVSVSDPAPAREPAPSCSGTTSQYDSAIRADVNTTVVTDYSMNTKDGRSSIVGIFAEFLQVFGLGGASIQFSKERVQSYAFEKMETTWFLPPLAFAQEALADQKVQGFLQMVGTRRPLYIISGVKTVWGADVSTKVEKSAGWARGE
ncbi:hypothetical protein UCDDS831_g05469 [Diplodia seriata]|uniref:Uncharacterized protein n=1 Tax=Diplodia seriata TaxID=420778 RepID=A0A0G2GR19_9PEZI|nr:hypothetical protein UCDDS831_g05469 [Diplodia seriata]